MIAEHKRRVRARILGTAAQLVAAHGASGLVMTTLARESGVARATLYNYFPDAERVLEGLVDAETDHFLADLQHRLNGTQDAGERLRRALAALVEWAGGQAARRPAHSRHRGPPSPAVIRRVHRPLGKLQDNLTPLVAAARDASALPSDTDPATATAFILTLVLGARDQLASPTRPDLAPRLHAFILGGLRLSPGPRQEQRRQAGPDQGS